MKTPTPHLHAEMIAEWIRDTSRIVECSRDGVTYWEKTDDPNWSPKIFYRFADTVKPSITSSLTDGELFELCKSPPVANVQRAIANAAAARAIEELPLLSCELNYSDLHLMWVQAKGDEMLSLRAIARAVRDDYIKQVKAGKK